jgi:ferric-dicitrate binding protein FerR (iron transport regulator)
MKKKNSSIDWPLLTRYFSEEISEQERIVVKNWIESDPKIRKAVESLHTIWELSDKDSTTWDVDSAWVKLTQEAHIVIPKKSVVFSQTLQSADRAKHFPYFYSSYAVRYVMGGVAILCLILSILVWHWVGTSMHQQSATQEISTEKGQQTKIELTDGTRIRLNAASVISFPEKFSSSVRECTLHGEAYFEVAHKDRIPFIVHMDGATIEVLGTEFNVQAWPEDKQINVVVAGGKVLFRSDRKSDLQQVVLTKGQMSHLSEKGIVSPPENVDMTKQLAWINGGIAFENAPLRDVLRCLERRYNLAFTITDSSLLSHRLTTSFKKEDPTNKILNIIAISVDLKYKRTNDTVNLYVVGAK